jgi:hypothetical protein
MSDTVSLLLPSASSGKPFHLTSVLPFQKEFAPARVMSMLALTGVPEVAAS